MDVAGDTAEEILPCYPDHETMEQYHAEHKTDLDLERLSSGKFAINSLTQAWESFWGLVRMLMVVAVVVIMATHFSTASLSHAAHGAVGAVRAIQPCSSVSLKRSPCLPTLDHGGMQGLCHRPPPGLGMSLPGGVPILMARRRNQARDRTPAPRGMRRLPGVAGLAVAGFIAVLGQDEAFGARPNVGCG